MNIKKAETDIKIAREILSESSISEYDFDAAAYHIQQAIEKSLKYYLSNVYGEDETRSAFKTHRIGTLMARCYTHGMNGSDFPEGLLEKADTITEWESGTRYGYESISDPDDVIEAFAMAEEMYHKTVDMESENNGQ